jgi:uncharacterized protein (UPF0548 family)
MFMLRKPTDVLINSFIAAQQQSDFSYSPLGLTRDSLPSGYTIDHNRVQLGSGAEAFSAAIKAFQQWKMFDIDWIQLCWTHVPIEEGSTVAVVVNHLGFWSMNACRIVYVVEEHGSVERYGFAYGTLAAHEERGEERFTVEWNRADDTVWYDILAVSRPGPIARLGYPYARRLQKKFADASKTAMKRN